jgi:hypothetical protein
MAFILAGAAEYVVFAISASFAKIMGSSFSS